MPPVKIEPILDLNPNLPHDIQKIAEKQGECSDSTCQLISDLRDVIFERGDCLPHRTDDEFLTKFLRARFWIMEPSYKLMCNYYHFREQHKEYYENIRPMELTTIGDKDIMNVSPYRDQIGRRIIIYRFGLWKPNEIPVSEIFKATLILLEMGSLEPISQVMGGVGIFDLQGLTFNHVLHLTPEVAQNMIALMVTSMPIRTTAIHIVNQNWAFSAAFSIFKPFLGAKMREKIFIHGSDMTSLHKYISPEYLPKRYGGVHDDLPYTLWLKKFKDNLKAQKELEQLGYVFDNL